MTSAYLYSAARHRADGNDCDHHVPNSPANRCTNCARPCPDSSYVGQYECERCDWVGVVWVACSRFCMRELQRNRR